MGRKRLLAATAAIAMFVVPGIASAATLEVTDIEFFGTGALPMATLNTTFHPDYLGTGPFQIGTGVVLSGFSVSGLLDGNPVDLFAYCFDIFEQYGPGIFGLSDLLGAAKGERVATLLSNVASPTTTQGNAAVQLALWEILYEDGDATSYDLAGGAFFATDLVDTGTAFADAGVYLNNVLNVWDIQPGFSFTVASLAGTQDLIFVSQSVVPEPASWAMMIGGFGLVGGALRARRRMGAPRVSFG